MLGYVDKRGETERRTIFRLGITSGRVRSSVRREGQKQARGGQGTLGNEKARRGLQQARRRRLDPVCGSGTTLLAALQLGRKCIGIDSSEKACEMAADRVRGAWFKTH